MNSKTKRRLAAVTGIIIIVLVVILAVVGGGTAAKTIGVGEAASGQFADQRVQVTGNVVKNSFATDDDVLTFAIYDPESSSAGELRVSYDGAASSTFGNDVTAICTGKMGADGVLYCSELVTKCPSKYESGTSALDVAQLLGYGDSIYDTTVRVAGTVAPGTQNPAGGDVRFALADAADGSVTVGVGFDGAASEETLADGAPVVVTGNMTADGVFNATDVSIDGDAA